MNSVWMVRPIGDLLLLCVGDGQPADADLDRGLDLHRRGIVNRGLVLCVAGNVALSPAQRKRSAEAMGKNPSGILTDSAITRGIMTAMSWLGGHMWAMPPSELRAAIAKIGVPAGYTIDEVEKAMQQLRAAATDARGSARAHA